MKKLINKIHSMKLPNYPHDKQKHFMLGYYASIISIMFMSIPLIGIYFLCSVILLAAGWELYQLIKKGFTKQNKKDSQKDFLMTFAGVFPTLVFMIYLHTR